MREPETPDEIRAEIAELARRRDSMLQAAPRSLFFRRLIAPLVFFPALFLAIAGYIHGQDQSGGHPFTWSHAAFLGVFLLLVGRYCWKLWSPDFDPRDPWAASDRIGYEGDSPRDLQRKIDRLEAKLRGAK